MSNTIFPSLTRQQGLLVEMDVVANNLANSSTTGFKADRAVFSEFIAATGNQSPSLSMGNLGGHSFDLSQGGLKPTGGTLDLALQGEGYFAVNTPAGPRLTRAGHFQLNAQGQLIDGQGNSVLNRGNTPITLPQEGGDIQVAADGTLSVDGEIIDQVGVFQPNGQLARETGTYLTAGQGFAPAESGSIVQGSLEQSNVSPVLEIARMISVQRAYEAGQTMLEREDQRLSQLIDSTRER